MFEKYRAKIYSRKLFQLSVCIFYFKKCGRINSKIYHVDHCGVYSSVALGTFTWLYRVIAIHPQNYFHHAKLKLCRH